MILSGTKLNLGPLNTFLEEVGAYAGGLWHVLTNRPEMLANIGWAAALMAITMVLSSLIGDTVKRMSRRLVHRDADRTLPEFFSQVVRWLVLLVGLVAVLNRLGVQTASLLTVLGAASLAIGLALQGTLSNVAAGLMLLFTKPYRIGDSVKIGDVTGKIHRLGLFSTEIDNVDNVRVYVPNTKVFSNEITNLSTNGASKVELRVEVGYGTDLDAAVTLLTEVAKAQTDHLAAHEVAVHLHEFAASGVIVRMWIWTLPANAPKAKTRWIIAVKTALDAAGIDIPYPHQVAIERNG
jgi:small conductance mechanosensitive channel